MKYSDEIRGGYGWSFLSPLLVTFLFSSYVAIAEAIESSIANGIGAFFGSFALFGFFSILFSGLFCGLVGVPAYYFLKKIGAANWVVITFIGGAVAFIYSLTDSQNIFFQVLYVAYGACSGFFFWFGTTRPSSPNKAIKNRSGQKKASTGRANARLL
ncbi:MAG: hypothetical protein ACPHSA_09375 [Cycloclasticus pugetii]|uniref:hypothetical protein n=1 Tax=Cycloclasticus TaxID=34067 RepID=UPI000286AB1F|nr:hypothetical protein [Cycloclasticus sp. P1]AFT67375.1 hypothetical protein Q91_1338 [Cycloclasticus sp. P1]